MTSLMARFRSAWPILWPGALTGGLFWCSIPHLDLGLAAWFCLIPALFRLAPIPWRRAWWGGMVAGVVAGTGRTYWIAQTLQRYGDLSLPTAIFTTVLLILYLALYWGAFYALCSRLDPRRPAFPWVVASLWVILEWTQSWMISGFPWQLLGYSQYRCLPLLQLASVTGVYGLSFLVALTNAGIARGLVLAAQPRRAALAAAVPLLLVVVVWLAGQARLDRLEREPGQPLTVAVLQGNVPQEQKWKAGRKAGATQHYASLARGLDRTDLDLVVFPETALPFFFSDSTNAEHRSAVESLARELNVPLLVGSLGGSWEEGIYNRAWLLDAAGQVAGTADKVHLVPFGEYLPFASIFRYLRGLTAESGAFTPGQGHRVLHLPGSEVPFGVFICYESIFPAITRALALGGAELLINTTNDAWFGRTAAPYQHFAMVAMRAAETGRPIVRAANTGISGLIAPSGRILHATGLFETTTITVEVTPRREQTLYTRYGDLLVLCCGVVLALSGWQRWRQAGGPTTPH